MAARSKRHHASSSSACVAEHDVATTHLEDGIEAGEATDAQMIQEEIIAGSNERFRVVDLVEFAEEDESPFVGLLQVEMA